MRMILVLTLLAATLASSVVVFPDTASAGRGVIMKSKP